MAEAALFSIAAKLLSTIASPALKKAYERGLSVWDAKDELAKLGATIEAVQAVLLDAEKKQGGSDAVKLWIKRVREVLYDADDLFDEFTTNDQRKQQMMNKHKHSGKVLALCSSINPVSNDSITKRVKAIRKSLGQIHEDMAPFGFEPCLKEEPVYGVRKGREEGHFVDPKIVVGREVEKKFITEFLFEVSDKEKNFSVVAIVGIGGLGKTTIAQLVYNDGEVQKKFGKRKWWACISDITEEKEVLGRIFKAMTGQSYQDLDVSQLQSKIVESVTSDEAFLLVLDDLWDSDHNRWVKIMGLLNCCAKGSKIIATTREHPVARAIDAVKTHRLGDLSPEKSWELFKNFAFTREQENDPEWTSLGEEIVKKCAGVPLAIRSIASILRQKTTIEEWVSFKTKELSKIESGGNAIMSTLKLSYDHLSSDLKHCFAYCSLFEKDTEIQKRDLIYLWAAQGYLQTSNESRTVEEVGHEYFMELLRRSLLEEVSKDEDSGEIESCKMHDLVHDLAQLMDGDQSIIVSRETDQSYNSIRHVSGGFGMRGSWETLPSLLGNNRLRSFLVSHGGSPSSHELHQHFKKFKFLRALELKCLFMEEVCSSIGELIHLRYLNLSYNNFKCLPDSTTELLNLISLNITWCEEVEALPKDFRKLINLRHLNTSWCSSLKYMPDGFGELLNLISLNIQMCRELEALPKDFRKLINLRHLDTSGCRSLKYMPDGFGELTSLQFSGLFVVGKPADGGEGSKLDALRGSKFKRSLEIKYNYDEPAGGWTENEVMTDFSMLAASLKELRVIGYPGMKILVSAPNLVSLSLSACFSFGSIPTLSSFANLKRLVLNSISHLEYWEVMGATEGVLFFPCLESLRLWWLPKFKGAPTTTDKEREHPDHHHGMLSKSLKLLQIFVCDEIVSVPGEALTSLQYLEIIGCKKLKSVKMAPPHLNVLDDLVINCCPKLMMEWDSLPNLRTLKLYDMPQLESFMGEALTSLSSLTFDDCGKLKKVKLPPADVNALEELSINKCGELELWEEEDKRGIDWDSLPKLRILILRDGVPDAENLPRCLQKRRALGNLAINTYPPVRPFLRNRDLL